MTATELLAAAERAGLQVRAAGERLIVRGPRAAEALGRVLLARKAEVLAVLTAKPAAAWDAARAAAVVAEVDARIDAAVAPGGAANTDVRRRLLANERIIVRRLEHARDPLLWDWPASIGCLLARWRRADSASERVANRLCESSSVASPKRENLA
jgi:hypothetical protein